MYEIVQDKMEMKSKWTYQVMRGEVAKENLQATNNSIQQKDILVLDICSKRCRFVVVSWRANAWSKFVLRVGERRVGRRVGRKVQRGGGGKVWPAPNFIFWARVGRCLRPKAS